MSHDIREALKPWNRQRIEVRGTLDGFGDWTHNRRKSLRACITSPEVDGKVIGHHVWVTNCKAWGGVKDRVGETVMFSATVEQYVDRQGKTNYCLTNPDLLEFLVEPPAMLIPDHGEREERINDVLQRAMRVANGDITIAPSDNSTRKVTPLNDVVMPMPEYTQVKVTAPPDPVAQFKRAQRFVKVCGGAEIAKRVAQYLADNDVDAAALLTWIDAMGEE